MIPVARLTDLCGGQIVTAASSVLIEGLPCARIGDQVSPHPHGNHTHNVVIGTGFSSIYAESLPVTHLGAMATCNVHNVVTSASTVYGGR